MVSITLSVPEEVRKTMKEFDEVNWSAFIRSCIEEKTKKLAWKEKMLNKLEQEDKKGFTDWAVDLGKKAKKGRHKRLK